VKHLNPRQGITTGPRTRVGRKHEQPSCVKHLNPRQGITTIHISSPTWPFVGRVKHLNPRQGITTGEDVRLCDINPVVEV